MPEELFSREIFQNRGLYEVFFEAVDGADRAVTISVGSVVVGANVVTIVDGAHDVGGVSDVGTCSGAA